MSRSPNGSRTFRTPERIRRPALDRHLALRGEQIRDHLGKRRSRDFQTRHVSRTVRAGVPFGQCDEDPRKSARETSVTIYLPMVPEAAVAMLAPRAGSALIHSVWCLVAFLPKQPLGNRLAGLRNSSLLIDSRRRSPRGGRKVALKVNADEALEIVPQREEPSSWCALTGGSVDMQPGRGSTSMRAALTAEASPIARRRGRAPRTPPSSSCIPRGSTGALKGVLYRPPVATWSQPAIRNEKVLDYREGEIYWCTADVGWVTGHSYILYGPLANGATTPDVLSRAFRTTSDSSRFSAGGRQATRSTSSTQRPPPTARDARRRGTSIEDQPQEPADSGSAGETDQPRGLAMGITSQPWASTAVLSSTPWWQTEDWRHLTICCCGLGRPRVEALARRHRHARREADDGADGDGHELHGARVRAIFCIADSWPGQMRIGVRRPRELLHPDLLLHLPRAAQEFTGDGAKGDEDGYFTSITGRVDDVINVSGYRMGNR